MEDASNIVRVPCGDVELALHDFGGSGPVLLLAHANGFPAMCYEPLVPTRSPPLPSQGSFLSLTSPAICGVGGLPVAVRESTFGVHSHPTSLTYVSCPCSHVVLRVVSLVTLLSRPSSRAFPPQRFPFGQSGLTLADKAMADVSWGPYSPHPFRPPLVFELHLPTLSSSPISL